MSLKAQKRATEDTEGTTTEQMPAPRGKFSRVRTVSIGATKFLYLWGMTSGGEAPFDIREQSEIIFRRMTQLLAEHGASLADLMKITAFLTDIREYDGYNEVRKWRDALPGMRECFRFKELSLWRPK